MSVFCLASSPEGGEKVRTIRVNIPGMEGDVTFKTVAKLTAATEAKTVREGIRRKVSALSEPGARALALELNWIQNHQGLGEGGGTVLVVGQRTMYVVQGRVFRLQHDSKALGFYQVAIFTPSPE